jgi:two-component system, LytTR family, sensor kinase
MSDQTSHRQSTRGDHAKFWLVVLSIATVVALIYAVRNALGSVTLGRPVDWWWGVAFEFNYWYVWAAYTPLVLWVANRFRPDNTSRLRFVVAQFGLGLVIALAQSATEWGLALAIEYLRRVPADELTRRIQQAKRGIPFGVFTNIIIYSLIIAGHYGYQYYRSFRERQLRSAELETLLARADLQNLKSQLQPHFLFNTLNTISVLMRRDPAAANQTLVRLSDLLRISLNNVGAHEVSLREELNFLDGYLEIEQTRFQDRLQIRRSIEPGAMAGAVPNLILQPLVENAIKHGIARRPGPGTIEITAMCKASNLHLEVRDDGPGLTNLHGQNGVGLSNTRRRLQQLYGSQHEFHIRAAAGGGVSVTVVIPFRIYDGE